MEKIKKFVKSINVSGISVGTWVRTIMLILSVVVFVLKIFDIVIPVIDENLITEIILGVVGVISFLQAYWKNNSITQSAQESDKIMQEKKNEV